MSHHNTSNGFTLLEVTLALALSALLFIGLGYFAVWQGHVTDRSHRATAESQTARVVLDQIARDLRNAIVHSDAVSSGTTEGSSSNESGSGGTGESEPDANDGGAQNDTVNAAGDDDDTLPALQLAPGINGTSTQIQIDTYFVPTVLDQWKAAQDSSLALAGPTQPDLLSVAYAVDVPQNTAGGPPNNTTNSVTPHLLRGVLPTATVLQNSRQGGGLSVLETAQSFAPYVRSIEFWYFDGTQWLTSWDVRLSGGLPVAIQVLVWVDADDETETLPPTGLRNFDASISGAEGERRHIFSSIVALPTAELVTTNSQAGGR